MGKWNLEIQHNRLFPAVFINKSFLVNSATCFGYCEPSSGTIMNLSINCYTLQFSVVVAQVKVLKILDYINF
jgi:hypothetical protein